MTTAPLAAEKRARFNHALQKKQLLRFPGAFSPLVAMLIQQVGFDGVYVSGAALSADLGLPDIGLTTQTEVVQRATAITKMTRLPTIVDIDTGFGEPANVARTIAAVEGGGLCGCHLEDQRFPKRCGHLDNKTLVPTEEMTRKIAAAVTAKTDPNFVVIARTDARGVDGMTAAIDRAKAYVDAGADMIFPEALASEKEFEQFRQSIEVPLMANMTEFGKSPLLTTQQLTDLGFNLVIYPVTSLRLAMKAIQDGLQSIAANGTQANLLPKMQTRQELYDLIEYQNYAQIDADLFNFKLDRK